MTIEQAIDIISAATEPQAAGRITRHGYAQIEQAIAVIKASLAAKEEGK
jgi:hypothetical protein